SASRSRTRSRPRRRCPGARSATRRSDGSASVSPQTSSCSTTTSTSPACSWAARCMSRCSWALAALAAAAVCMPAAAASPPDLTRLVGQTIMTGFPGTHPSAGLLARIRRGEVGGVIFFGGNLASAGAAHTLVARLQAAAAAGGNPRLLVAIDQEGGPVRRLPEGPPKAALDARLAPFTAAVKAGVELVMVSNAGYRAYDPSGLPAVLSRRIVTGLLRGKLGFDGVVISDSLSAPGPSSRPHPNVTAIA